MANLPQIPRRTALTEAPRSSVTAADVATPYRRIGEAMQAVGQVGEEIGTAMAVDRAQKMGGLAVTRDENGNLSARRAPGLTAIGQAWNRAVDTAFVAETAGDVRKSMVELRQANPTNVEEFEAAARVYETDLVKRTPPAYQAAVQQIVRDEVSRHGPAIISHSYELDMKRSRERVLAEVGRLDDEMAALARTGGTGSDDYLRLQAQMGDLVGELVGNPEFAFPQEKADELIRGAEGRHLAESVIGTVAGVYEERGLAAAEAEAERLLWDPDLGLSPDERRKYANLATSELRQRSAVSKADLAAARQEAISLRSALESGTTVGDDEVGATVARLAALGDAAGAGKLLAAHARARLLNPWLAASDREQVDMWRSGTFTAPGDMDATVDAIIRVESAGDPVAKNKLSTATGLGQFVADTWLTTIKRERPDIAAGKTDKELLALRTDPALSREMTRAYAEENAAGLERAGYQATPRNIYLAHHFGLGGARRILSAPDGSTALSVLGPEIVRANPYLRGKTIGDLKAHWDKRFGAASAVPPELVDDFRKEFAADAKRSWPDIRSGIEKGYVPEAADLDLFVDQVVMSGDRDLLDEVRTYLSAAEGARLMEEVPPAEREALMQRFSAEAGADGWSMAERWTMEGMRAYAEREASALDESVMGWGIERRTVAPVDPIDWSTSDTARANLADRARKATIAGERYQRPPGSVLMPQERQRFATMWGQATADERARMLGDIVSGVGDRGMVEATISGAVPERDRPLALVSGGLMTADPEIAASVLRGADLLAQNPSLAPQGGAWQQTLNPVLPRGAFAPEFAAGAYQPIADAVRARYADLVGAMPEPPPDVDQGLLARAVDDVTGGVLRLNGGAVIAPERGMSQATFDNVIRGLPESRLSGAVMMDGRRVPAEWLRAYGRLKAIGPGEYLVQVGPDDAPTFVMDAGGLEAGIGVQPFVLRLGPSGEGAEADAARRNDVRARQTEAAGFGVAP